MYLLVFHYQHKFVGTYLLYLLTICPVCIPSCVSAGWSSSYPALPLYVTSFRTITSSI